MLAQPLINVLVNVDTAALVSWVNSGSLGAGTQQHPTPLDSGTNVPAVLTLTTQTTSVSNVDTPEIVLKAAASSQLNWTISGFDSNAAYTNYFYDGLFVFYPSNFVHVQLSQLDIATEKSVLYVPPGADPTAPPEQVTNTTQRSSGPTVNVGDAFWTILKFVVVDNSNGRQIGHFRWIPRFRVESTETSKRR